MSTKRDINRIVFYSKDDATTIPNLIKSEKLLNNFNSKQNFSFNDLLEFYNIKLYFDDDLFLIKWSKSDKEKYSEIIDETWKILKERLLKINDQNIEEIIEELGYNYKKNFWELINNIGVYKNISGSKFKNILNDFSCQIGYILPQKNIVQKFKNEIREFLLVYKNSAKLLLSQFEEKKTDRTVPKYYFPKGLSLSDKESIINTYLDSEDLNLNYLRLVEKSIDSNELKLSDRTRYKAKKRSEEQSNEILEKGYTSSVRVQVGLSKDQKEPVIFKNDDGLIQANYSENFLDKLDNDISLFCVFKHLFNYTDETSLITLVSKISELDVMESIVLKSKNEYEFGQVFRRKEILSILQLLMFENYLKRKNCGIEGLINSFVLHLNELIAPNKLLFQVRLSESPYLDKICALLPSFDFLLKQYKYLADEGSIDLELLRMSSKPIGFSQITSQANRKYIYSNDKLILQLKHLFFSDQSLMCYTEAYGTKHTSFFDLITQEKIVIDDFENFQKDTIQSLIKDGYLKINNENLIEIEKSTFIYIIRELHINELLNYWNYPKFVRDEIDLLIREKKVLTKNTLFSKEEVKYFNFHLNKKTYTNGYDLRNKYLHGTNTQSEQKHENDYYLILKIIILALLKIEDDIMISTNPVL